MRQELFGGTTGLDFAELKPELPVKTGFESTTTNTNSDPSGLLIGDPRVPGRVYVGTGGRGILYADPR